MQTWRKLCKKIIRLFQTKRINKRDEIQKAVFKIMVKKAVLFSDGFACFC